MAYVLEKGQKQALKWLINRGGSGCITAMKDTGTKRLLAGGQLCQTRVSTFQKLDDYGYVHVSKDNRIDVTTDGYALALDKVDEAPCYEGPNNV